MNGANWWYDIAAKRTGDAMTVQVLKLGRERFVLLKEKDYRDLQSKAQAQSTTRRPRLTAQDRGDIAEAVRRRKEPTRPYADVRKELGLA